MSLEILKTTEMSKIQKLGTFGVIDADLYDSNRMHYANPEFWGIGLQEDGSRLGWKRLTSGGPLANDRKSALYIDAGVPYIYTFDGETSTNVLTSAVYRYNINTGIWTSLGNTSSPRKENGVCTLGDTVYSFGGWTGAAYSNTLTKMVLPAITRTVVSGTGAVPVAREACGMACHEHNTLGWCLYMYGGRTASNVSTNHLYRFQISTGIWTLLTPSPTVGVYSQFECVGDKLYAIGGSAGAGVAGGTTTKIECYDIYTDAWSIKRTGINILSYEHSSAVIGDKIYVNGTAVDSSGTLSRIWVYDTVRDTFTFRFPGGKTITHGDMVMYNNSLYINAGNSGTGRSNVLWKWDVNNFTLVIKKVR